jgi:hypothetical protein
MRFIIRIICLWLKYVAKRPVWVYLDDLRPTPSQYDVHARTAAEAIALLRTGKVQFISLDHDLGEAKNGTGYDVAKEIEEAAYHGRIPPLFWGIHSANPVGRKNMQTALKNADKYWRPDHG